MAWKKNEPQGKLPGCRAAHSCDKIGNKLYIFGGWNGLHALDDLHILDIQNNQWSEIVPQGEGPTYRNNHTTAAVGTKLFIHGGHDGTNWLDDLYILETMPTLQWLKPQITGKIPSPRACHSLNRVNKKLYLFGGYDGHKCFDEMIVLEMDKMQWTMPDIKGQIPVTRNAHTMCAYDTKLYLFGGHSGTTHLFDLHIFDTDSLTWIQPQISGNPPKGLRGHTANLVGSNIYVFGGYDGNGRSNDLYIFNVEFNRWLVPPIFSEMDNCCFPSPRQRHTACNFENDQIAIFGGFDGNKWLNDLYVLDVGLLEEKTLCYENMKKLVGNIKQNLFDKDVFSDVVFALEGKKIFAHKVILVAQSEHFKAMFQGGMKEENQTQIQIQDWSYKAFYNLLEFIYSGFISYQGISYEILIELLGLSDAYLVDGLKILCQKSLSKYINLESSCDLLIFSQKFSAYELKKYCLDFIVKNFSKIYESKEYEKLEKNPQLLIEVTRLVFNNTNLKEI